ARAAATHAGVEGGRSCDDAGEVLRAGGGLEGGAACQGAARFSPSAQRFESDVRVDPVDRVHRCDDGGEPPFHVGGAAADDRVVAEAGPERVAIPALAGGNDIRVAEAEDRRALLRSEPGVEVLPPGLELPRGALCRGPPA